MRTTHRIALRPGEPIGWFIDSLNAIKERDARLVSWGEAGQDDHDWPGPADERGVLLVFEEDRKDDGDGKGGADDDGAD